MVNIEHFIKRMEKLLDYYSLTASSFADKIGVQRSSISHLLSGRNKPSLDFILKILEVFPEVDLYWLLNGSGSFPKSDTNTLEPALPSKGNSVVEQAFIPSDNSDDTQEKQAKISPKFTNNEQVEKIVVFYHDGTFKEYKPNKTA